MSTWILSAANMEYHCEITARHYSGATFSLKLRAYFGATNEIRRPHAIASTSFRPEAGEGDQPSGKLVFERRPGLVRYFNADFRVTEIDDIF